MQYLETSILLAVMEEDDSRAEELLDRMNKEELRTFATQVLVLHDLIKAAQVRAFDRETPALSTQERINRLFP